ncbi:hypothetical protein ACW6AV_003675, partial [Edwardsiella piscicida]
DDARDPVARRMGWGRGSIAVFGVMGLSLVCVRSPAGGHKERWRECEPHHAADWRFMGERVE